MNHTTEKQNLKKTTSQRKNLEFGNYLSKVVNYHYQQVALNYSP